MCSHNSQCEPKGGKLTVGGEDASVERQVGLEIESMKITNLKK
jgi:hypothetical protein